MVGNSGRRPRVRDPLQYTLRYVRQRTHRSGKRLTQPARGSAHVYVRLRTDVSSPGGHPPCLRGKPETPFFHGHQAGK